MANNAGKKFEADFRDSVPTDIYFYRFRDGTASWGNSANEAVRFQADNIADCLLFKKDKLFILELKTTQGQSLPFGNIRIKNLEKMVKAMQHENIIAAFIINFRDVKRTYFVLADNILNFIQTADRKSIPQSWCVQNGIEIPSRQLKVNYRYDIQALVEQFVITAVPPRQTKRKWLDEVSQFLCDNRFEDASKAIDCKYDL